MNVKINSLGDYVNDIRERGLVKEVQDADWNLEIGALTEIVAFSKSPKCLLFDKIKGYTTHFKIATNLYITEELQAIALGLPTETEGVELVRTWRERLKKFKPLPPRIVNSGPILENVVSGRVLDILQLIPVPVWHKYDGGRYLGTGDVAITRDADEDWINMGVYRSKVQNGNTLGIYVAPTHHCGMMFKKYWEHGKEAPIVMTFGQDPFLYAAACAPLEWGKSELDYAGAIKGEPIEVITDVETGLPIPAHAEIAIVGRVPPPKDESMEEGPFGECTGYYTGHGPAPVIHVDRLLYRNNAILQGSPPMYGGSRTFALGGELTTSAAVWDTIEREIPSVSGVYSIYEPCQSGSTILVIAIKQSYPGHAKHAGYAALSSRAAIVTNKMVVVVDDDVNPASWDEVVYAMTSRCNPSEDIKIVEGIPSWPLDPTISKEKREIKDYTSSTMIIDATRKPFGLRKQYPRTNILDKDLRDQTIAKWRKLIKELD